MSRVLVIDDEPTIRRQMCEFLEKWNVDVVGVGNLIEAEREMTTGNVTVVIQDLILREREGDVFEFIGKHCGPDRGREAIAITGHLAQADLRRVVDAGAFCFFKKPVDLDELLIATWAAQQRADRVWAEAERRR
jgi:DNA-binding NtrC family response regulator